MARMKVEDVPRQMVAVVRRTMPADGLVGFFDSVLGAVAAAVQRAGGSLAGAPFGWYRGATGETVDVAAGFPVMDVQPGSLEGDVEVVERPGGLAAVADHIGPYDTIGDTYRLLSVWFNDRQLDPAAENWEEYLTDPQAQLDPADWETRIVWPLA